MCIFSGVDKALRRVLFGGDFRHLEFISMMFQIGGHLIHKRTMRPSPTEKNRAQMFSAAVIGYSSSTVRPWEKKKNMV